MHRRALNGIMTLTVGGLLVSGYLGGPDSQASTTAGGREPSRVAMASVAMIRPLAADQAMPSADIGCVDQRFRDGSMHNSCTDPYKNTSPATKKDMRDCMVGGGIGGATGSLGGPGGAAAGAAGGCVSAIYSNHSH
jgi:hypothetical protein